jgi:CheY-like chemotaxis protein
MFLAAPLVLATPHSPPLAPEPADYDPVRGPAEAPASGAPYPGLYGLQVFVVEDEAMVAMMLEDMLADFGCIISGVAGTLRDAQDQLSSMSMIDAAILDVNLGGEFVFPVADMLVARNVPFVFSTAYGTPELLERYPRSKLLRKPYAPEALAKALSDFIGSRSTH